MVHVLHVLHVLHLSLIRNSHRHAQEQLGSVGSVGAGVVAGGQTSAIVPFAAEDLGWDAAVGGVQPWGAGGADAAGLGVAPLSSLALPPAASQSAPVELMPLGGAYESPLLVTLTLPGSESAGGGGSGAATMYYTLDGSLPRCGDAGIVAAAQVAGGGDSMPEGSGVVGGVVLGGKGSIELVNSSLLRVVACEMGRLPSQIAAQRYELRASPPVLAPASGHFRGPRVVTLTSATAGAHIVVASDGSWPSCPSIPWPPSIEGIQDGGIAHASVSVEGGGIEVYQGGRWPASRGSSGAQVSEVQIVLNSTCFLHARACRAGLTPSDVVASGQFHLYPPSPWLSAVAWLRSGAMRMFGTAPFAAWLAAAVRLDWKGEALVTAAQAAAAVSAIAIVVLVVLGARACRQRPRTATRDEDGSGSRINGGAHSGSQLDGSAGPDSGGGGVDVQARAGGTRERMGRDGAGGRRHRQRARKDSLSVTVPLPGGQHDGEARARDSAVAVPAGGDSTRKGEGGQDVGKWEEGDDGGWSPASVPLALGAGVVRIGPMEVHTDKILGHGSQGTVVYSGTLHRRRVAIKRVLLEYVQVRFLRGRKEQRARVCRGAVGAGCLCMRMYSDVLRLAVERAKALRGSQDVAEVLAEVEHLKAWPKEACGYRCREQS